MCIATWYNVIPYGRLTDGYHHQLLKKVPFSKKKKQLPFPASFILSLECLHFISWKALSISLLTLQTVTARFELSQSRFPTPRSIPLNGLSVLAESPVAYMAGERIEATTIMNPSCKPQVNNSSDPQIPSLSDQGPSFVLVSNLSLRNSAPSRRRNLDSAVVFRQYLHSMDHSFSGDNFLNQGKGTNDLYIHSRRPAHETRQGESVSEVCLDERRGKSPRLSPWLSWPEFPLISPCPDTA